MKKTRKLATLLLSIVFVMALIPAAAFGATAATAISTTADATALPPISMAINTSTTVTITGGARRLVSFTPTTTGTYTFTSSNRGSLDPKAYDINGATLNDDGAGDYNYTFTQSITAGQTFTYYTGVYADNPLANGSYTITVTGGPTSYLTLSLSTWGPGSAATSASVAVTSNVSWTATSNATSWLTVTPASGSNMGTLAVSVTANTGTASRTGTITVYGSGIARTISVTQAGIPAPIILSLNTPASVSITSGARRAVSFTPTATGTYTFTSSGRGSLDPKAYDVSGNAINDDSAGDYNYTFTQSITAGQAYTYYSGVYADASSATGSYTVTVTGGPTPTPNLALSISSWTVSSAATTNIVTVTSNFPWTATSNATSWLTVTPASGSSNGTLYLYATQFIPTSSASRSGTITVSGGGITKTIVVTQNFAHNETLLYLNTPGPIRITSGDRCLVRFIPPSTGTYTFTSSNDGTIDP